MPLLVALVEARSPKYLRFRPCHETVGILVGPNKWRTNHKCLAGTNWQLLLDFYFVQSEWW